LSIQFFLEVIPRIGITSDVVSLDEDMLPAIDMVADESEDLTVETAVLVGTTNDVTVYSNRLPRTLILLKEPTTHF